MREVIKTQHSWRSNRALLVYGVIITLLLLIYGARQWQQYQHYRTLAGAITPVLAAVQDVDARLRIHPGEQALSSSRTQPHMQAINQFVRFIQQNERSPVVINRLVVPLQRHQQRLAELQNVSLHNNYARQEFANATRLLDEQQRHSGYQALLARSNLYVNAPNMLYLYNLDEMAKPLITKAKGKQQEALYFYQQYRHSLEQMIQLRELMASYEGAALHYYQSRWQEQRRHYGQRLLQTAALLLLLYIMAGVLVLLQRNRQLRQASEDSLILARTQADFLANMSHEIRTPMNAIIGFSALLQHTPLSGQQSEYLKKITHSSDSLLLLINDILDLTKVEVGKLELENIEFDLDEQLERWSGLFVDLSDQKQLEIIIDKSPTVPRLWYGDPLRLGQIIVNLVSNAVKFTERGQVVLRIFTKTSPDFLLCFSIQDTGIGIMPEQLDRLFHSFTQMDASTTRKYGGSGLGLSISHHLVQLMQGTLTVSSQLGLGSTFTACLPLTPSERVPDHVSEPLFMGKTALLVENNPQAQHVLARLLKTLGFNVVSATNNQQAKAQLEKRGAQLDLALIHCRLEHNDCLALINYMRQQPYLHHLKIVVTSAFSHASIQAEVASLAIDYYLPKPITEYGLSASLQPLFQTPPVATAQPPTNDLEPYQAQLQGKRLLLVEDNKLNQQLVKEFLTPLGVHLELADHGRHALELIAKQRFDAILMDLQMPIMGGIEATRQIRKLRVHHDIPIIALTASAMREDREAGLQAGMNAYVTKPIHRLDLYRTLSAALYPAPLAASNLEQESKPKAASADSPLHAAFMAQHQDDIWLIKGYFATEQWEKAQQLVTTLITHAECSGLAALADSATAVLGALQQQQRPSHEQLTELSQQLAAVVGAN